ncbi:hypothetical protein [Gloeocapsopsis dulcis]|uniref:Uncharacterized protein n=1 Tax=Gloeocapsopsis dulcis AAB1 = 1H9 TaxID=1433147 RepID=A0A6N8FUP0_9CHRO|nr:hypothetical protein [Gloeocapsopsis dulcis]MUL36850.1 hypothetical protein [Gloeocapsopsis dulcis AAB1 = 1H9]WNN88542.1 hypothetical protein P0S91_19980 [Gloeocapsopsis dulcis]
MSSQDSWSCLSVQQFFSLCNWQGQALENYWQYPNQPLNSTLWQSLSVQQFFSLCNWQGQVLEDNWQHLDPSLYLTLQAEAAIANHHTSWQCLSVQEFFSLCHWQGQRLERTWHLADSSMHLTFQVREFFQFLPWEGNPEIGSLPNDLSTSEPTLKGLVTTTLTDLSELF